MGERRRIALLAHGHEMGAGAFGGLKLGLGLSLGEDADRGAAAAARQGRQGVERRLGAAELIDQRAEGRRADILAADQPEPAQALAVAQLDRRAGAMASCGPDSGLLRANAPLLASQQASDIVGVAPIEKHGEEQEQHRHPRLPDQEEQAGDGGARRERRER